MAYKACFFCMFAYAPIASQAFLLASDPRAFPQSKGYVNVEKCPQTVSKDMWGLWIDGRDAHRGIDAYGGGYHSPFMSSLTVAYNMAKTPSDVVMNRAMFVELVEKLNTGTPYFWRGYANPCFLEVKPCHEVLPPDVVQEIMSTVNYKWTDACMHFGPPKKKPNQQYAPLLGELFKNYSDEVRGYPGRRAELLAIARIAQKLAFLHPLSDCNGKSRAILIQYLLRARHIGCGTMMHNNNKNIYFSTASQYATLLDEGTTIYHNAAATNFSINPWTVPEVQSLHNTHYPTPAYMAKLKQCWSDKIQENPASLGTSPERALRPQ